MSSQIFLVPSHKKFRDPDSWFGVLASQHSVSDRYQKTVRRHCFLSGPPSRNLSHTCSAPSLKTCARRLVLPVLLNGCPALAFESYTQHAPQHVAWRHSRCSCPPSRNLSHKISLQRYFACRRFHPTLLRVAPKTLSSPSASAVGHSLWADKFRYASICPPSRTRTYDPLLKRELLYQLSYGRK